MTEEQRKRNQERKRKIYMERPEYRKQNQERKQKFYAKHPEYSTMKSRERRARKPGYVKEWCIKNPAKYIFFITKARANRQKRPFLLTLSWVEKKLAVGICEQTGLPLSLETGNRDLLGGRNPWFASIDRIDSSLNAGYTEANCQMVCAMYNFAKSDWTDADVLKMAKSLVKARQTSCL